MKEKDKKYLKQFLSAESLAHAATKQMHKKGIIPEVVAITFGTLGLSIISKNFRRSEAHK